MPPFDKRVRYWFAPVVQSVGLWVGRFVYQAMSAQYLLTTLLERCQTWCSDCLKRVDDLYWSSVLIVKGQSQTAGLSNAVCPISSDSFAWKLLNLIQWMSLGKVYPKNQCQTPLNHPKYCLLNLLDILVSRYLSLWPRPSLELVIIGGICVSQTDLVFL